MLKKIQEFKLGWEDVAASRRSKQGTHYPHYPIAHAFNTYRSHTDETPNMISHWGPAHTRVHLYLFFFLSRVDVFGQRGPVYFLEHTPLLYKNLYERGIYKQEGSTSQIKFGVAIDKFKHGYGV